MKLHRFLILAVAGQRDVSVCLDTTRACIDTGCRMILPVNGGYARVCQAEGNIGHFTSRKVCIVFIAAHFGTYHLALLTSRAVFLNNITGLAGHVDIEVAICIFTDSVDLAVQHQRDIGVACRFRHLGRGDTRCTVERREHLAQLNHLTPDGKPFFHQQYPMIHVCQTQCCLLACNATSNDQRIEIVVFSFIHNLLSCLSITINIEFILPVLPEFY